MSKIKQFFGKLGFDGWANAIIGIVAIAFGLLDFIPQLKLDQNTILRLILIVSGLLLTGFASQSARRSSEIDDIKKAINLTETRLVYSGKEGTNALREYVTHTKKFILDTTLTAERANIRHPLDAPDSYHNALYQRVRNKEISYRRVEIISTKERLEYAIMRLIIHDGTDYLLRYFGSQSKPLPVLNVMSFDNESILLGGFYTSDAPAETVFMVSIKSSDVSKVIVNYWETLWHAAKPLNEGGRIDWQELKFLATQIGVSELEFTEMIDKWKNESRKRNRK